MSEALTGVSGDKHGGAAEVACPAGDPGALPVTVERVGGVRHQRVRQVARPAWRRHRAAVRARPARVVHRRLHDRARRRRVRDAP